MIETFSDDPIPPNGLIDITADLGPQEERGGNYGLRLEVVSPHWEDMFRKISGGKLTYVKKNGFEGELYDFPQSERDAGFASLLPSTSLMEPNYGKPTLYFIRMKGLSKGVNLFFMGMHEFDLVRKYAQQAADESQSLYKKLMGGRVKVRVILDEWKSGERERVVR